MKAKLLLLSFLVFTGTVSAQVDFNCENQKITINAATPINFEHEIDFETCRTDKTSKKAITFYFEISLPDGYSISIKRNAYKQEPLAYDNLVKGIKQHTGTLTFDRNTEYEITITASDDVKKVYKIRTKTSSNWTTTFGANAIFFSNRNVFISQKNNDTHTVAEIQDRKQMDVLPVIMFTFLDNSKGNFNVGFSGGFGTNFQEIAIYTGLTLGIGQNVMLTGGVAVNKQVRPNSNYSVGQIIDSTITNDNLNVSEYRFNPFVGLTFRLNKNPFANKEE